VVALVVITVEQRELAALEVEVTGQMATPRLLLELLIQVVAVAVLEGHLLEPEPAAQAAPV
jgi:hypothetical protein